MLRVALALAVLMAVPAVASIELGPPSSVVAPASACPGDRCLAVAGDARHRLVVWSETANFRARLMAAADSGAPVELHSGPVESLSVAFDGREYLVAWRRGAAIHGARLSLHGALIGNRMTFENDPGGVQALATGLGFAVVMPRSVVYLRDGLQSADVDLDDTVSEAIAVPVTGAVNGSSILVVREGRTRYHCSGFSMVTCWGGDYFAASTLIGTIAMGNTERVLGAGKSPRAAFSVAAGGDGYVMVWWELGVLYALRLDQSGLPVGTPNAIAQVRKPNTSSVLASRDGWVVTWDDLAWGGTTSTHVAELDANGALIGKSREIATKTTSPALIKLAPDRYRLYYRTETTIESRLMVTGTESLTRRRRAVR